MRRQSILVALALLGSSCVFREDAPEEDDSVTESQADALAGFSRAQKHNLAIMNRYRATKGLVALRISATLSDFARAGSDQISIDHRPHGHFRDAGMSKFERGFRGSAAENQGDPHGWPELSAEPDENELRQIDEALQMMFDEGPGEGHEHGHYENIMNPRLRRVGIGFRTVNGRMYLTNDFSE